MLSNNFLNGPCFLLDLSDPERTYDAGRHSDGRLSADRSARRDQAQLLQKYLLFGGRHQGRRRLHAARDGPSRPRSVNLHVSIGHAHPNDPRLTLSDSRQRISLPFLHSAYSSLFANHRVLDKIFLSKSNKQTKKKTRAILKITINIRLFIIFFCLIYIRN